MNHDQQDTSLIIKESPQAASHPTIRVDYWKENKLAVGEWLNNLTEVVKSNSFWMEKGEILTMSHSTVVQNLLESMLAEVLPPPSFQLFDTDEAKVTFESEFLAAALSACGMASTEVIPAGLLGELVSKGTSNSHPIKMQFLACPPNYNFKLHAHPTIELAIPFVGELWERRLMGARLHQSIVARQPALSVSTEGEDKFHRGPSDEEIGNVKKSLQKQLAEKLVSMGSLGEFVDRGLSEGQVLLNEVGSIHQSYTQNRGCLLLVLWSGMHADLENYDCCAGVKGSESLFLP
jgi:hypothetical protein